MYHIIYQTTNLINGKTYIGKHSSNRLGDNYLGSGNLIKHAIEKYGKDNFIREDLFVFDDEDEAYAKETELVNAEFVAMRDNYNLVVGGKGAAEVVRVFRK